MSDAHEGLVPINAMMGWNEGVESKNDAIELAKGFIQRRYTAVEASWYAVAPFMGGFLWEVHEGGPGKGYIGSAISSLSQNPSASFWFPSGDRAFQVMMRDGKPFGILLSKAESLPVINSGQPALAAITKMTRAVRKGTAVFMAGASLLGSGVAFLAGSMAFYAIAANPGPSLRTVDFSALPHAQWNQVANTEVEEIVSRLQMTAGKWSVEKRPHVVPGLRELREDTQKNVQKARDAVPEIPVIDEDGPAQPPAPPATTPPSPQVAPPPVTTPPATPPQALSPAEQRRAMRDAALRRTRDQGAAPDVPDPVPVPVDNMGRRQPGAAAAPEQGAGE